LRGFINCDQFCGLEMDFRGCYVTIWPRILAPRINEVLLLRQVRALAEVWSPPTEFTISRTSLAPNFTGTGDFVDLLVSACRGRFGLSR
jgi:hypothetical protein